MPGMMPHRTGYKFKSICIYNINIKRDKLKYIFICYDKNESCWTIPIQTIIELLHFSSHIPNLKRKNDKLKNTDTQTSNNTGDGNSKTLITIKKEW